MCSYRPVLALLCTSRNHWCSPGRVGATGDALCSLTDLLEGSPVISWADRNVLCDWLRVAQRFYGGLHSHLPAIRLMSWCCDVTSTPPPVSQEKKPPTKGWAGEARILQPPIPGQQLWGTGSCTAYSLSSLSYWTCRTAALGPGTHGLSHRFHPAGWFFVKVRVSGCNVL